MGGGKQALAPSVRFEVCPFDRCSLYVPNVFSNQLPQVFVAIWMHKWQQRAKIGASW